MRASLLSLLVFLFAFIGVHSRLAADDVQFNLAGFTSGAVTNRKVLLTPLALYPGPNQVASYDPALITSTNGSFIISNMTRGLYRADIQAPPARTSFAFFVETNGTGAPLVSVDRLQRVTPAEVKTPQDYAYSAQASDARYVQASGLSGYVTNGQTKPVFNTLRVNATGDPDGIEIWRGTDLVWRFSGGNIYGYDFNNEEQVVAITIDSVGDIMALGGDAVFYRFYGLYYGGAAGLTNANASTLFGSGTVPAARLPQAYTNITCFNTVAAGTATLFQDVSSGDTVTYYNGEIDSQVGFQFGNQVIATEFKGLGSGLTYLNAGALGFGTVPLARLPGYIPDLRSSNASITNLYVWANGNDDNSGLAIIHNSGTEATGDVGWLITPNGILGQAFGDVFISITSGTGDVWSQGEGHFSTLTGDGSGIENLNALNLANRTAYPTNRNSAVVVDATKVAQTFVTNASFAVSGFSGVAGNSHQLFAMCVSNSSASSITWTGPPNSHFVTNGLSTNVMSIPAGQEMIVSFWLRPGRTNYSNCIAP